ncbi:adenosine kinase, putative [Eimeria tenella]|uniref:Adenosine kinase n=1 Tax=Eimeria tenella TaxID=5802 RepID=U6KN09_EIMTE|nr:adenosine kinase, putative [Eimeria tenella]CDJ37677.1 adenosine kinase, putative [Eimeria tenella]|eukprot:XP_013228515.1 adenosine kinase, putative [Eimeria tenella]
MVLLSACNPLLDIVAEVPRELLQQFDLPFGGAVLAAEKQIELFSKIPKDFECSFLAGGCGQNTVRVYQALCGNKVRSNQLFSNFSSFANFPFL